MVDWKDYNNFLRGEYNRFLLKTLSHNEESYLNILNQGVSDILDASIDYVALNIDSLNGLDDDVDEELFGREFWDGFTEQVLITMLWNNVSLGTRPLRKFYLGGSRIAYNELDLQQSFYNTDQQALNNLEEYVGSVVKSINNEYCIGVKQCLFDNRYEDLDTIHDKLLVLGDTPIHSNVCVNNRCLYTTRTEYARAVNTGLLQTYCNYGVSEVDWVTSGLGNVCNECLEIEEGSPYTVDEVIGLGIPHHPNCQCSVKAHLPINPSLQHNGRVVDLTPKKKGR